MPYINIVSRRFDQYSGQLLYHTIQHVPSKYHCREPYVDENNQMHFRENCNLFYIDEHGKLAQKQSDSAEWVKAALNLAQHYDKNQKHSFGKVHSYTIMISWPAHNNLSHDDLLHFAQKVIEEFLDGYACVVGTHLDKPNPHLHITFSSIRRYAKKSIKSTDENRPSEFRPGGKFNNSRNFFLELEKFVQQHSDEDDILDSISSLLRSVAAVSDSYASFAKCMQDFGISVKQNHCIANYPGKTVTYSFEDLGLNHSTICDLIIGQKTTSLSPADENFNGKSYIRDAVLSSTAYEDCIENVCYNLIKNYNVTAEIDNTGHLLLKHTTNNGSSSSANFHDLSFDSLPFRPPSYEIESIEEDYKTLCALGGELDLDEELVRQLLNFHLLLEDQQLQRELYAELQKELRKKYYQHKKEKDKADWDLYQTELSYTYDNIHENFSAFKDFSEAISSLTICALFNPLLQSPVFALFLSLFTLLGHNFLNDLFNHLKKQVFNKEKAQLLKAYENSRTTRKEVGNQIHNSRTLAEKVSAFRRVQQHRNPVQMSMDCGELLFNCTVNFIEKKYEKLVNPFNPENTLTEPSKNTPKKYHESLIDKIEDAEQRKQSNNSKEKSHELEGR